MSAPNLQDLATANTDDIGGTRATGTRVTDSFDTHTDLRQVADVALAFRPKDPQVFKMDTIRSMLRDFLDSLILPQPTHPTYLDGVLPQWLDVWKEDRSQALLIYVLGFGIDLYKGRTLDISNLYPIDLLKTRTLERQCSKHGVRIHLARMTSDVYPDPDNVSDLKTTSRLYEVHDLQRGLLVDKPFTVKNDSLLQKSLLRERYYRTVGDRGSHPPPCEGSPVPQPGIPRSYHDWVSLSRVPPSLLMLASHKVCRYCSSCLKDISSSSWSRTLILLRSMNGSSQNQPICRHPRWTQQRWMRPDAGV